MKNHLKAWARSVDIWFKGLLLALVPYTKDIVQGVHDNLPSFAPYLPQNIYQTVGCIVVAIGLVQSMRRASKAAMTKESANG